LNPYQPPASDADADADADAAPALPPARPLRAALIYGFAGCALLFLYVKMRSFSVCEPAEAPPFPDWLSLLGALLCAGVPGALHAAAGPCRMGARLLLGLASSQLCSLPVLILDGVDPGAALAVGLIFVMPCALLPWVVFELSWWLGPRR
jgi:hypothetical protein